MVYLDTIRPNKEWSFRDVKRRETLYATHGYHRYPAKFIPQLVQKLLIRYSKKGDIVLDSFGGCGTTLVEAKLSVRNSIGFDVNKVAVFIARSKTREIDTELLQERNRILLEKLRNRHEKRKNYYESANSRLQYWFKPEQYNKLKNIYNCIQEEKDSKIKLFYNCCFSNILKTCSIWYSKSIKPMRDFNKKDVKPVEAFIKHLNFMTKRNEEFVKLLKLKNGGNVFCKMDKGDARRINLPDKYVDLIITSPPYVTSYEYADLHQLSTLWFGFTDDIRKIKKDFIGTSFRRRAKRKIDSKIAEETIKKLCKDNKTLAGHISNYYFDLGKCYKEMFRVLKPSKCLCLIIGNTEYKNIKIPNAEASIELLTNVGFKVKKIIKRKLSSKIFTPYRNKTNGKFTSSKDKNKKRVYQYEYILIFKKG